MVIRCETIYYKNSKEKFRPIKELLKMIKTVCETIYYKKPKEKFRLIKQLKSKGEITDCNGFLVVQYHKGIRV